MANFYDDFDLYDDDYSEYDELVAAIYAVGRNVLTPEDMEAATGPYSILARLRFRAELANMLEASQNRALQENQKLIGGIFKALATRLENEEVDDAS